MRKLILTVALVALLAVPVMAQRFGGGFGLDGNRLLGFPDVQKELKLSEEQKKSITEASSAMQKAMRAAFQDMDREAIQKAQQEYTKTMTKLRDGLKPAQTKRLLEIEVQVAASRNQPSIFTRKEVETGLKLTAKQKETVKDALSELQKDTQELFSDAKGDREKMTAAFKKVQTMGKDTFEKITKSLTEDQKKTWKDMQGEKFELKMPAFPGTGRPKSKTDKKDDF